MTLSFPLSDVLRPADAPRAPARAGADAPCPGLLVGMWPDRTVSACVRRGGHVGDHRDASGYRWNDERWLD